MNSQLDRMFERGLSDISRAPKTPLSDEQIAAAAKESRSGAVLWLRMHAKGILLCIISLAVVTGSALLITHLTGNQGREPEPTETVAAVVCDTTMSADDTDVPLSEPTVSIVETRHGTSLQNDQPVTTSATPKAKPAENAVETRHGMSLPVDRAATTSVKPTSNVSSLESQVSSPVVVKKTIVQRDTVVINETVIIKDTTYVQ